MEIENTLIFALSSSQQLADEICAILNIKRSPIRVDHFADGEILIEPEVSVRGKNVYLVQSTNYPVSEHYMEVLIALDSFKRASAKEVTVVSPYYGYARQDRKARARQPITAKLMDDLLQAAGADRVVTLDLHAPQIQGFFDIPIDDLTATSLFGQYYRKKHFNKPMVIVSPDHGGATRARKLSDVIPDSTIAIIDKRRTQPNVAESINLIGDVKGKIAVLVDDIIDTGGSLLGGVQMLLDKGAVEVYCAVSHGVLSKDAIERIEKSNVKELVITNSIEMSEEKKRCAKIKQISIAYMLSKTIEAIQHNDPVSDIWKIFNED